MRITLLGFGTSLQAKGALRTGKHVSLDAAWLEAHRTNSIAGGLAIRQTIAASHCPPSVEADNQRPGISHPRQTLKQADRAQVATKQMPGKQEVQTEDESDDAEKHALISAQGAVPQVGVDFCGWQDVGQKHDSPAQGQSATG